jgi:hypothetical protein
MDGLCYLIEDVDAKQHLDYLAIESWMAGLELWFY